MKNTKCPKCNNDMEMRFKLWCPICDKPKKETIEILDLLTCLRYLEVKYKNGIENRFREYLNENFEIKNDSFFTFVFPEPEDEEFIDKQILNDIKILKSEFDCNDVIVFEVIW